MTKHDVFLFVIVLVAYFVGFRRGRLWERTKVTQINVRGLTAKHITAGTLNVRSLPSQEPDRVRT